MPIRVTCQCGQTLNVPDSLAGKSGNCPKCKAKIQIPSSATGATKPAAVKPVAGKPAAANTATKAMPAQVHTATSAALDDLLARSVIPENKGPTCPGCSTPIAANAIICVHCGLDLATGKKIKGFQKFNDEELANLPKFNNEQLDRAAISLKKEFDADEAAKYTGAPWWVSLAILLGLIILIYFGLMIVEGLGEGNKAAAASFKGRLQRQSFIRVIVFVIFIVASTVASMATVATMVAAFKYRTSQGFLCFIPFYTHYFAFKFPKRVRSTARILFVWSAIWGTFFIFMFTTGAYKLLLPPRA